MTCPELLIEAVRDNYRISNNAFHRNSGGIQIEDVVLLWPVNWLFWSALSIKADTEALEKAFYPIAEKLYKEQQAAGGAEGAAGGQAGADGDGNYYGADFEDKT